MAFVVLTCLNAIYTIHFVWQLNALDGTLRDGGPVCNRILSRKMTSVLEISRQEFQKLSSRQFYENYVQARQAVVIRGAYDNHSLSVNRELFSDQYMLQQFQNGTDFFVKPEIDGTNEDRDAERVRLTLEDFVRSYQTAKTWYLSGIEIEKILPKRKNGPGLQFEKLQIPALFTDFFQGSSSGVTALLWWSTGGTKTVIHVDDDHNFESIFYGPKVCLQIDIYTCNKSDCSQLCFLFLLIFSLTQEFLTLFESSLVQSFL